MTEINLIGLTMGEVRNLAGHDRGLSARDFYDLDELDSVGEVVEIILPEDFRAISPSFFQGMFAKSVHHFASVEGFFEHYHFDAPLHIRARLIEYAQQTAARTN